MADDVGVKNISRVRRQEQKWSQTSIPIWYDIQQASEVNMFLARIPIIGQQNVKLGAHRPVQVAACGVKFVVYTNPNWRKEELVSEQPVFRTGTDTELGTPKIWAISNDATDDAMILHCYVLQYIYYGCSSAGVMAITPPILMTWQQLWWDEAVTEVTEEGSCALKFLAVQIYRIYTVPLLESRVFFVMMFRPSFKQTLS